jgi:preprotein translocase subunit SecG
MGVFIVIQIIVTVFLVFIVLMQKSTSEGLVSSSGNSVDSFLAGRQAGNFLTKLTSILATVFIINSLILSILAAKSNDNQKLIDKVINLPLEAEKEQPKIPTVPKSQ